MSCMEELIKKWCGEAKALEAKMGELPKVSQAPSASDRNARHNEVLYLQYQAATLLDCADQLERTWKQRRAHLKSV